jgi:predicted dehydrogenase
MKVLLEEGRIGRLVSIQHSENVGYYHHAHSYVRGNWRNSEETSPMILAKSCHDMDLIFWLAGAQCRSISSFGSLAHFKRENAPEGAPERCNDNCPVEHRCPFSALKIYEKYFYWQWPRYVVTKGQEHEDLIEALKTGPYGRCVYKCDNNVVDNQVVSLEFENGITAAFTMCAFTNEINRLTRLMGTSGELTANLRRGEIEIADFRTNKTETVKVNSQTSRHEGGDEAIVRTFIRMLQKEEQIASYTSADVSIESHLMAFAAEKSRLERKTLLMKKYKREQGL